MAMTLKQIGEALEKTPPFAGTLIHSGGDWGSAFDELRFEMGMCHWRIQQWQSHRASESDFVLIFDGPVGRTRYSDREMSQALVDLTERVVAMDVIFSFFDDNMANKLAALITGTLVRNEREITDLAQTFG